MSARRGTAGRLNAAGRPRHRFAIRPEWRQGERIRFSAEATEQMRRVLRLGPGDLVGAFDGSGQEYLVRLTATAATGAVGEIEATAERASEPRLAIRLAQALLPRDRFELVLQKGTEVGVAGFVPLVTERSLVPAGALGAERLERWRRIVQEAAEQSGRTRVPRVEAPVRLAELLGDARGPLLLAWEREAARGPRRALAEIGPRLAGELTLVVGPEGGFGPAEIEAAVAAGALTVSLGPRILRAETAGPILAALALYALGELEPGE